MPDRTVIAAAYIALVILMSCASFLVYAWDKRKAKRAGWRTKEGTLLAVDLLGGWPGGFIAQRTLRHKNRKRSYQLRFWAAVLIHITAVGVSIWLAIRF